MVVGGCYSGLSGHKSKKVTSSERSTPQIYRVTQRLVVRSRRTPRVLILLMLFGPFRPPKPGNRILLRSARMTFMWRVGDAQNQRLLGFLLSAKQVSAYRATSWAATRATRSPVGTTEVNWRQSPQVPPNPGPCLECFSRPCGTFPDRMPTQDCVLG